MNFDMMTIDNVNIEIERKPIKNLHLAVYPPEGRVHVSSPKQWSDEDIRSFVISRWDWVSSHRKEIINQARQTHREYVDGESYYILGVKYRLEVKFANVTPSIEIHGGVITMTVRPDATEEKRAEVMREYMRSLLKEEIADMIERWCGNMNIEGVTWIVKRMKTRWGSCVEKKKLIQLNLELARLPRRCIEYVIVHELCHLSIHGHNRMFEKLITKYLPNWQSLRNELNSFVALPMEV